MIFGVWLARFTKFYGNTMTNGANLQNLVVNPQTVLLNELHFQLKITHQIWLFWRTRNLKSPRKICQFAKAQINNVIAALGTGLMIRSCWYGSFWAHRRARKFIRKRAWIIQKIASEFDLNRANALDFRQISKFFAHLKSVLYRYRKVKFPLHFAIYHQSRHLDPR